MIEDKAPARNEQDAAEPNAMDMALPRSHRHVNKLADLMLNVVSFDIRVDNEFVLLEEAGMTSERGVVVLSTTLRGHAYYS